MRGWRAFGLSFAVLACTVPGVNFAEIEPPDGSPGVTTRPGSEDEDPPGGPDAGVADAGSDPPGDTGVVPDTDAPAPTPCSEDRVLLGNDNLTGLEVDNALATEVNAFPYEATVSASARCLRVNLSTTISGSVFVGVYDDASGTPGKRIARGTISAPVVGWNKAVLDVAVTVAPTARLWLAIVPQTGEVDIKVRRDCNGRHRHSNAGGTLPATFVSDGQEVYCNAAFFLSP